MATDLIADEADKLSINGEKTICFIRFHPLLINMRQNEIALAIGLDSVKAEGC